MKWNFNLRSISTSNDSIIDIICCYELLRSMLLAPIAVMIVLLRLSSFFVLSQTLLVIVAYTDVITYNIVLNNVDILTERKY